MSLPDFWNKNWKNKLIVIGIAALILITVIVIAVVVPIVVTSKESFTSGKAVSQNIVNVNGHEIDCTPEINFMTDYIKSAQELY